MGESLVQLSSQAVGENKGIKHLLRAGVSWALGRSRGWREQETQAKAVLAQGEAGALTHTLLQRVPRSQWPVQLLLGGFAWLGNLTPPTDGRCRLLSLPSLFPPFSFAFFFSFCSSFFLQLE